MVSMIISAYLPIPISLLAIVFIQLKHGSNQIMEEPWVSLVGGPMVPQTRLMHSVYAEALVLLIIGGAMILLSQFRTLLMATGITLLQLTTARQGKYIVTVCYMVQMSLPDIMFRAPATSQSDLLTQASMNILMVVSMKLESGAGPYVRENYRTV